MKSKRLQTLALLACGACLGYLTANSGPGLARPVNASPSPQPAAATKIAATEAAASDKSGEPAPAACCAAETKSTIVLAQYRKPMTQKQSTQDKKPNILFIMGDDIGWMQPGCYHRGL